MKALAFIQHGTYFYAFGDDATRAAKALQKRCKYDAGEPVFMIAEHDADFAAIILGEAGYTVSFVMED